jgi:hypothetical protein
MEKGASLYSYAWIHVNNKPYPTVQAIPFIVDSLSPAKIARWAAVIVTPEDNKIIVFHSGNPQALTVVIPTGGQIQPIPTLGDSVQWKKLQKKLKKNITSEAINKHIPNLIPS